MTDAGSLSCPRCGAPAEPEAGSCRYCGTHLALVSCPQCFARLFRGAKFCPACGTKRSRRLGEATNHQCPACRKPLSQLEVGSVLLEECAVCRGSWVDADTFEQLCEDRQDQAAISGRAAVVPPAAPPPSRRSYIPCPECKKLMLPMNFAKRSGVVIDVCREHGVWFDTEELCQVLRFIGAGGYLEELVEKERRDLEQERRSLQQRLYRRATGPDAALLPKVPAIDPQEIIASVRRVLQVLSGRDRSRGGRRTRE